MRRRVPAGCDTAADSASTASLACASAETRPYGARRLRLHRCRRATGIGPRACTRPTPVAYAPAMKVDGGIPVGGAEEVARAAKELEEVGYDGGLSAETNHDPFFPLVVAAEHTEQLELGTGIAVAFARSPMTLANIGYDLQTFSKGRFRLGLGSQIKAHIEKRFSMPWSHPAPRHARARPRAAGDLGVLERRGAARLPRRVLSPHADDAVLRSRCRTRTARRRSSSRPSAP